MERFYKICLILFTLLCLSNAVSYAASVVSVNALELSLKGTSFQEKPKPKKAKSDSVESPIRVMFRDLLEYLYFPGIPEDEKNNSNNQSKKKSKTNKKEN